MPRTFYRAVETAPPTRADFLSDAAKGRPPRPPQRQNPALYRGISVFDNLEDLEDRRERVLALGHHFPGLSVALDVPDGAPVQIHKTGGSGHYTLVGDPDVLLAYVVP
jgi:hypothetical protein